MRKIFVIGMPFSIHTKRWIAGMLNLSVEIHFFSSFEYSKFSLEIPEVVIHDYADNKNKVDAKNFVPIDKNIHKTIATPTTLKYTGKLKRKLGLKKDYAFYLARCIEKIEPDIVHTLETQHAAYLLNDSLNNYNLIKKFEWIHSTWGIDLHYFMNFKEHAIKLKSVFSSIDIYCAEGQRDLKLAKGLGYNNTHFIFPSVGGYYEISEFTKPTSKRDVIIIKGNQNEMRKALNGLKALERIKNIENYNIVVFSATNAVIDFIKTSSLKNIIEVKSHLSHHDMIELTKNAILSITINLSDGLPNSFIEALACGAFPIQSNTSMANEWIENGKHGFLVDPLNIEEIAAAITASLSNKERLDKASIRNRKIFIDAFKKEDVITRMEKLYLVLS